MSFALPAIVGAVTYLTDTRPFVTSTRLVYVPFSDCTTNTDFSRASLDYSPKSDPFIFGIPSYRPHDSARKEHQPGLRDAKGTPHYLPLWVGSLKNYLFSQYDSQQQYNQTYCRTTASWGAKRECPRRTDPRWSANRWKAKT